MNNYLLIGLLISVVGFFLRDLHTRLKQAEKDITMGHESIIELKSEHQQMKTSQDSGFIHIEKLFDEKFKSIDKTLEHMNNNIKSSNALFKLILDDNNKK